MGQKTTRICLWSGPRNISTAMMYAFAQRADARVVDEPLYAHYLSKSEARHYHPGSAETLSSMPHDGQKVMRDFASTPLDRPVLFLKQMTHHLIELDWGFLAGFVNIILTRNPREMLPSYATQIAAPTLADTGYAKQVELLDYLTARGQTPLVLDAELTLRNPRGVLEKLCAGIGIDFDEGMLQWPAGARPEDGVWARYWYASVHRSTGFAPYRPKTTLFPPHLESISAECAPFYTRLRRLAIDAA